MNKRTSKSFESDGSAEKVVITRDLAIGSAQMLTNFAFMFAPVSGLSMIGIAMTSRSLMKAVGVSDEESILKVEDGYSDAFYNYSDKMIYPYKTENEKLKKEIESLKEFILNKREVLISDEHFDESYIDEQLKELKIGIKPEK